MRYALVAATTMLLGLGWVAAGTDHPHSDKANPPGFDEGNKTGWESGRPPGWSEGNKQGWDNKRPPGLKSNKDHDHYN